MIDRCFQSLSNFHHCIQAYTVYILVAFSVSLLIIPDECRMLNIFYFADPNNHLSINAHFLRFSILMGFIVVGIPIGFAMIVGYVRTMFERQHNCMDKSQNREKYINKILVKVCNCYKVLIVVTCYGTCQQA